MEQKPEEDKKYNRHNKLVPPNFSVPKYKLASIYKGLHRLNDLIRKMQFFMTKVDRRHYGDDAVMLVMRCLSDFCIAFDFQDERPHYYMKLVGDFHALTSVMDVIDNNQLLNNVTSEGINTRSELPGNSEKMLLRIYEEIGNIDTDISKWRPMALRSTSGYENPLKQGGQLG